MKVLICVFVCLLTCVSYSKDRQLVEISTSFGDIIVELNHQKALADRNYINALFLKGAALFYVLTAFIFVYTLLTIEYYSASTIIMLFSAVSLGQIISIVWQVLVGRKMMTH